MLTTAQLVELDAAVCEALEKRDNSGLNLIGFGEISVALGVPKHAPVVVCKPSPPVTRAQFEDFKTLVADYSVALEQLGAVAVETEVLAVDRDEHVIAYQVQPLLDAETLGERVLGAAEPDREHPFLVKLAEIVARTNNRVSVDAQVTNWSWDGETATMLDLGTPMMWDESGAPVLDTSPHFAALPAPVRGFARKDILELMNRWKQPRAVAADVVANLIRVELEAWVEPTLAVFNDVLAPNEPLNVEEARASLARDVKSFPRLKKMQQVERFWAETVRRRRYDFFVQPSKLD